MKTDFAAAMRRATELTRAGDLAGATGAIRLMLSGKATPSQAEAPGAARRASHRPSPPRIDPDAETVEPFPPHPDAPVRRAPRRLGGVVALLRRGGALAPGGSPSRSAPPRTPDGAQWIARSFVCAEGRRDYRLYVPAAAPHRPSGLVVMLHGCRQNPEDFATGVRMNALAEAHGLLVAYPAQTAQANPSSCWRWYEPGDQRRGAGEPAIIAGLTQSLAEEFAVPRNVVFIAGLSAGGAMAAILGEAYPELYDAVGVHSGLAVGAASDVASAFAAMRSGTAAGVARPSAGPHPRMIVFHGAADRTVHPHNAARIVAAAVPPNAPTPRREQGRSDGGRVWDRIVVSGEDGAPVVERWLIEGAGHAWSGGDAAGSYTDPQGPDASAEMVRFFLSGAPR